MVGKIGIYYSTKYTMADAFPDLDNQLSELKFSSYIGSDWDKTRYYTLELTGINPEYIRLQMIEILTLMQLQRRCYILQLLSESIMQSVQTADIPFTLESHEYKTIHIKCFIKEE